MRLIDADTLKEWIAGWFEMNRYYHPYSKGDTIPTTELYDLLDRIPTIAPKHGRWIKGVDEYDGIEMCKCSECGYLNLECEVYQLDGFRYCPNCGAEMDEVGNEAE